MKVEIEPLLLRRWRHWRTERRWRRYDHGQAAMAATFINAHPKVWETIVKAGMEVWDREKAEAYAHEVVADGLDAILEELDDLEKLTRRPHYQAIAHALGAHLAQRREAERGVAWRAARRVGAAAPPAGPTVTIYRYYDANGELLYVGMTGARHHRTVQHARQQPWWRKVEHATYEHVPAGEATEYERHAIVAEQPKYNKAHRPKELPS